MKQYDKALLRRKFAELVDGYINSIPSNSEAMSSNDFEFPLLVIAFVAKGDKGVSFTSATSKVVPEYDSQNSFETSRILTKDDCKIINEIKDNVKKCLSSIADTKKQHATRLHRQFGRQNE